MACAMTWNVENFFPPGRSGPTKAVYTAKLGYLAGVIAGVAPDVLALQEVGGARPLADLQTRLAGAYPHARLSAHPDPRGIRVAVLSRWPLSDAQDLLDFPAGALPDVPGPERGEDGRPAPLTGMGRGALAVTADVAGAALRVMTVHLKSKLLTFPAGRRFPETEDERARGAGLALLRRAAEAVAVRVWLDAAMSAESTPTVLMGDLNDGPSAVTTVLLAGPEDAAPAHPDRGDPVRLYNVAARLPPARAFSRIYKRDRELIDHILVSRPLLLTLASVDALVDDITAITESVKTRVAATVPDHAPVLARFPLP